MSQSIPETVERPANPPSARLIGSPIWWTTKDADAVCREMYERHYSGGKSLKCRIRRNTKKFIGPGEYICLRTWEGDAFFVWRRFIDGSGQQGVNCAIFRNESGHRSSDLIRQADAVADFCWPGVRHYTYVNARRIRSKNPGCCFKAAGWRTCGQTKGGLVILENHQSTDQTAASACERRP